MRPKRNIVTVSCTNAARYLRRRLKFRLISAAFPSFQLPLAAPYYFLVCVLEVLNENFPGFFYLTFAARSKTLNESEMKALFLSLIENWYTPVWFVNQVLVRKPLQELER